MNLFIFYYIGPFFYGLLMGGLSCIIAFFLVFRRAQQITDKMVRKKAIKLAEREAVAKAAAQVPSSRMETICRLVRFDDDVVSEAVQCRAVLYGSTILFYAIDELGIRADYTQEVRREHLFGKINTACVNVTAERVSKYHRHTNAAQRHAPVKGKCTVLTAKEGMPLFVVDPSVRLRGRLHAAREERNLFLRQMRLRAANGYNIHSNDNDNAAGGERATHTGNSSYNSYHANGGEGDDEDEAAAIGPMNIETVNRYAQQEAEWAARASAGSAVNPTTGNALGGSGGGGGCGVATTGAPSSLSSAAAQREPWLDGDLPSSSGQLPTDSSSPSFCSNTSKGGNGGRSWWAYATGLFLNRWNVSDADAARVGSRGNSPGSREGNATPGRGRPRGGNTYTAKTSNTNKKTKPAGDASAGGGGGDFASPAALAKMEEGLYGWTTIAIKFPTRRENERWLNILQATAQTQQWRDFITHLPQHDVLNLLLARLFFESTRTSGLHDLLVKKISKNLAKTSKGLKDNLKGNIYLDKLVVGGEVPLISGVSDPTNTADGDLEFDFDVLYRGGLGMSIRFAVTYRDIRVPDIIFNIKVLELAGRLRLNVGPPPTEKLWLGCVRPPSLRLEFTQEVASHEGFLNTVLKMLPDMSKIMTDVVKVLLFEDMALPSMDDFPWPVFDDTNTAAAGGAGGPAGSPKARKKSDSSGSDSDGDGDGETSSAPEVSRKALLSSRSDGSMTKEEAREVARVRKLQEKERREREKAALKAAKKGKDKSASALAMRSDDASSSSLSPKKEGATPRTRHHDSQAGDTTAANGSSSSRGSSQSSTASTSGRVTVGALQVFSSRSHDNDDDSASANSSSTPGEWRSGARGRVEKRKSTTIVPEAATAPKSRPKPLSGSALLSTPSGSPSAGGDKPPEGKAKDLGGGGGGGGRAGSQSQFTATSTATNRRVSVLPAVEIDTSASRTQAIRPSAASSSSYSRDDADTTKAFHNEPVEFRSGGGGSVTRRSAVAAAPSDTRRAAARPASVERGSTGKTGDAPRPTITISAAQWREEEEDDDGNTNSSRQRRNSTRSAGRGGNGISSNTAPPRRPPPSSSSSLSSSFVTRADTTGSPVVVVPMRRLSAPTDGDSDSAASFGHSARRLPARNCQ